MKRARLALAIATMVALALPAAPAMAATDCSFAVDGSTWELLGDCTTDSTISVPAGTTLDGNGYTITAVNPPVGTFLGAVVLASSGTVHITDLGVTASGLSNQCQGGNNSLRGVYFNGASGSLTHSSIVGINKGASGCQEGNAVEIRNSSGVEVAHNEIDDYQKTGIAALTSAVSIHHNDVGDSATQQNLAANSIQVSTASGTVEHNQVDGNQWLGASNFAGTAVLATGAGTVTIRQNNVRGNSDVGVYLAGSGATADNNKIFDEGVDGPHGDYGLVDLASANTVTNNKVKGFDTPYYGVTGGKNKAIPGGPNGF
jgi:hypothetical protein